jgi:hypothetical protein
MSTATTTPGAASSAAGTTTAPAASAKAPVDIMMERLGYQAAKETTPNENTPATPPADGKKTESAPAGKTEDVAAAPAAATTETPKVKKVAPVAPLPPVTTEQIEAAAKAGANAALAEKKTDAPPAATTIAAAEPTLSPEDQAEVELATYASTAMPEKYKDLPAQIKAWVQQRDEFIAAKAKELGGAKSQEFKEFLEGDEFKDFIKANRPGFRSGDRSKVEREKIKAEASAETDKKLKTQQKEFERKLAAVQLEPVIKDQVGKTIDLLLEGEDDVLKAYREKPDVTLAERPLEAKEVHTVAVAIQKTADEYLRVSNGLIDPDPKNPLHQWLDQFITDQDARLDKMPAEKRTREGRLLVSHATYDSMKAKDPKSVANVDVFTPEDVLFMIVANGRATIDGRLQEIRTSIEKSGFKREAPKPAATTETTDAPPGQKEETQSPKAGASKAPGHKSEASDNVPLHLKILGYKKS